MPQKSVKMEISKKDMFFFSYPKNGPRTDRHTDRQTDTEVNTEDTLSRFQEFFLELIITDRSNMVTIALNLHTVTSDSTFKQSQLKAAADIQSGKGLKHVDNEKTKTKNKNNTTQRRHKRHKEIQQIQ